MNRKERRVAQAQGKGNAPKVMPTDILLKAINLHQSGNLDEAEAIYNKLYASFPRDPIVLNLLGMIHVKRKRFGEAIELMEKSIAIKPDYVDAYLELGNALLEKEQYEKALSRFSQGLAIDPQHAELHNRYGIVLHKLKRYKEALDYFNRALALNPKHEELYFNRGITLFEQGDYEEALTSFGKAIKSKPRDTRNYINYARILECLERYDEAFIYYDKAIGLEPENVHAHWRKSLFKLLLGQFEEGWPLYEWRWKLKDRKEAASSPQPVWLGKESLEGKTILLHGEQGLGDVIQFCRYVPMVEALGAKVLLGVSSAAVEIVRTLKGNYTLLEQGSHSYQHDFQCPLLSLPLVFGTELEKIPAQVPYLYADSNKQALWKERLGPKTRPRIGLVWSGAAGHENDHNRSIPLSLLTPLFSTDVEFHSLQKEVRERDKEVLAGSAIISHADQLLDFTDTAALIMEMDQVISVDTSVVHLAGALAKPAWILLPHLPDWRWLLGREDSPWYPTARLFRQQKPGDWEEVIARVAAELKANTHQTTSARG